MWLKCLLSQIYGLRWLLAGDIPDRPETPLFTKWAAAGRFPDGTIFHQHYEYSDELADAADRVPAHLVTIIRDPYDAFVSTYFTMQQHNPKTAERPRKRSDLYGKDLQSEEVLQMLKEGGYLGNLMRAEAWMRSGRAHVLRYEELLMQPAGTLTKLTNALAPASQDAIAAAVAYCSADAMRQRGGGEARHVRAATVGDSHNHLTEEHLAIFRADPYARYIESLGYSVR
jgi:hypothetical protein